MKCCITTEIEEAMTCRKVAYPDKKAAVSQMNRLRKVRGRHNRPMALRAYYCRRCDAWHLTKKPLLPEA